MLRLLASIFGWPHELLHVLALWLIGRRAVAVRRVYVDIPDDLSLGQYLFVAGLPALVHWSLTGICAWMLLNAQGVASVILWLALTGIAGLAALGTLGDLGLIFSRLLEERTAARVVITDDEDTQP